MQKHSIRRVFIVLAAAAALAMPPLAMADSYIDDRPSYGAMLVDGVIARPLGLGATVVGAAAWVVTLPFSALGGNVGEAADKLIMEPARFTFVRPLGEL